MMKSALIFGATSAIAQEVAKIHARQGAKLFLVARDEAKLLSIAENLHVLTGHKPDFKEIDFSSTDQIAAVIQQARNKMEGLDMISCARHAARSTHLRKQSRRGLGGDAGELVVRRGYPHRCSQ